MTVKELEAQVAALRSRPLTLLCRTPSGENRTMTVSECVKTDSALLHVVCDDLDALLENELTRIDRGNAAERIKEFL